MDGECWRWLGYLSLGRPRIGYKGKYILVSRLIMWITQDFDFKSKLHVLHKTKDGTCKFVDCWNPEHLYIGTNAQNMADRVITHCKRGHELTVDNTVYSSKGRQCRECKNERTKLWNRKQTKKFQSL
jgi:hypothetical protein